MSKSTNKLTVLLVGPHGVVGGAVRQRLTSHSDWDLVTASRWAPTDDSESLRAVSVDLLDTDSVTAQLASLANVTMLSSRVIPNGP